MGAEPEIPRTSSASSAGLSEQVIVAAVAEPDAPRERADVADLIRHVQQRQRPAASSADLTLPWGRSTSWCDAAHRQLTSPEVGEHRRQLCAPGGFRRDHLHAIADAAGVSSEQRPETWSISLVDSIVRNVCLYEASFGLPHLDDTGQPLLDEGRRSIVGGLGNLGVAIAVFKGNLGSNIFYMPHAWQQGGYVFGAAAIFILAALSVFCVILLIRCREGNAQSYGELMERATGQPGRWAVSACVVLLQVGTCCSYLINVANMLRSSFFHGAGGRELILLEAALISPLVLIRNVAKLSPVNLVGGVLTIAGVFLTFFLLGDELGAGGEVDVQLFNPKGAMVSLGIACFTFEGIGLVIPIYDSCRSPQSFPLVYSFTLTLIVLLITGMSALGYSAFGEATRMLVLLNLAEGAATRVLELTFSVVMLAGFPLQLLPALRIVEGLFLRPSRPMTWDKHAKSAFRVVFVGLVAGISILGATSLDHFVSLIGALCGLPLAFIFPALCHHRLVAAPGSLAAAVDVCLILFGAVVTVLVSAETIMTWGS